MRENDIKKLLSLRGDMEKGIKEKDIRDFEKYATKLNEVIVRIRQYNPEVNVYLAMEDLCLMNGPSHDIFGNCKQERVVTSVIIESASGGDW